MSSRNQRYYEEVYEIDSAIGNWTEKYQTEVQKWKPVLINEASKKFPFDEVNTADFRSQFSNLDKYTVVKYILPDIKEIVKDHKPKVVYSKLENGEFNITTTLVVQFGDGQSLTLQEVPIYAKKKSPRSQKDCTLNNIGIWNTTDNSCYVYNQLSRVCYIIDQIKFPNLAVNYTEFP